jgi:hypothetical protein
MTGRKSLSEVRSELEAAFGSGPTGDDEVAESLRRFLAAGRNRKGTPNQALQPTGGPPSRRVSKSRGRKRATGG